jgi:DNA (cytosine-5)-methyltransferase 1
MYRLADLFCGAGTFSLAFKEFENVEVVFSNDYDESCCYLCDINFERKCNRKDINDLDVSQIPKMDIITAGFPCQPFSIAGKRKGFEDNRSNVFFKLIEIIKYHKPQVLILENVKGIVTHDNGNTLQTIIRLISEIGYRGKYKVINTSDITDIPHNRERLFIVSMLSENNLKKFRFPPNTKKLRSISSFLENNIDEKYYYSKRFKVWDKIKKNIVEHIDTNTVYQYRRTKVRKNMNSVCPCLTANMGSGGHNVPLILDDCGIRKLTPRECFNLQDFPKTYRFGKISDSKLYKIVGNSITLSVIKKIVKNVMSSIDYKNKSLI